jgi:ribosome-binding ATPase YchF (GTP1/OBG family)
VPAAVEFVDIAGLVKGASEGEGLGNQFLSHIREVDAIAHVVRIFDNPNVASTREQIDPLADIELINTELELADLGQKDEQQKLSTKPMLYVLNKESNGHNLDEMKDDQRWMRLMEFFDKTGAQYVIVDAGVESELKDLHHDDKQSFRQEYGVFDDGINELIKAGYKLLGPYELFYHRRGRDARVDHQAGQHRPRGGGGHTQRL